MVSDLNTIITITSLIVPHTYSHKMVLVCTPLTAKALISAPSKHAQQLQQPSFARHWMSSRTNHSSLLAPIQHMHIHDIWHHIVA